MSVDDGLQRAGEAGRGGWSGDLPAELEGMGLRSTLRALSSPFLFLGSGLLRHDWPGGLLQGRSP